MIDFDVEPPDGIVTKCRLRPLMDHSIEAIENKARSRSRRCGVCPAIVGERIPRFRRIAILAISRIRRRCVRNGGSVDRVVGSDAQRLAR